MRTHFQVFKQYTYEIYNPPYPNTKPLFRIHKGTIADNRDAFHPCMCQVHEFKRPNMVEAKKYAKEWYKHYLETRRKA